MSVSLITILSPGVVEAARFRSTQWQQTRSKLPEAREKTDRLSLLLPEPTDQSGGSIRLRFLQRLLPSRAPALRSLRDPRLLPAAQLRVMRLARTQLGVIGRAWGLVYVHDCAEADASRLRGTRSLRHRRRRTRRRAPHDDEPRRLSPRKRVDRYAARGGV